MLSPKTCLCAAVGLIGFTAAAAPAADKPVQLWDERYVRVRPGTSVRAVFHLTVADGYHLVGHGAEDGPLQRLELQMERARGVAVGKPIYPKPTPVALPKAGGEVPAYAGVVTLSVPIKVATKPDWTRQVLFGRLAYQVCSETACLPPATLPVSLEVEVADK